MKSEERRELHAHELQRWSADARRFFESYATQLIVVVCALVLLAVGWWAWRRSVEQSAVDGWTRFNAANSAQQYAEIADDFAGSEVARWARLRAAESHLHDGAQAAFSSRDASRSSFRKAEEGFESLLSDRNVLGLLRQRAMFGLATAREATSDGNVAPAIDAYQELVREFGKESLYGPLATERIAALQKPEAQEFYAWFHRQKPKPRDRTAPADIRGRGPIDLTRPPWGPTTDGPLLPDPPAPGPSSEPPSPPPLPGDVNADADADADSPAPRPMLPPEDASPGAAGEDPAGPAADDAAPQPAAEPPRDGDANAVPGEDDPAAPR